MRRELSNDVARFVPSGGERSGVPWIPRMRVRWSDMPFYGPVLRAGTAGGREEGEEASCGRVWGVNMRLWSLSSDACAGAGSRYTKRRSVSRTGGGPSGTLTGSPLSVTSSRPRTPPGGTTGTTGWPSSTPPMGAMYQLNGLPQRRPFASVDDDICPGALNPRILVIGELIWGEDGASDRRTTGLVPPEVPGITSFCNKSPRTVDKKKY